MLRIDNIAVTYGDRPVLHGVTFELREGRVAVLLGPNGAGKTTLLRALNATLPITSGQITIDGQDLSSLSRRRLAGQIAVVAQENETRFPITVLEFVLAGRFVHGGAFGWETESDIRAAKSVLSECDLGGRAHNQMNELSGGERQRVVLARALATGASVLLLDEPTANLDLAHQAMMFQLVRQRCRDRGASAIVIIHDLNLAAEFADDVIVLDSGHVSAIGRPAEVLTAANINKVFGVDVLLDKNPVTGKVRVTNVF